MTNCCGPKILDEIFLRQKVHIPQQLEETSRTPGGSEALTFIMRFSVFFNSSMILILVWNIVCRDIFDNIVGYLVVDVWGTVVF